MPHFVASPPAKSQMEEAGDFNSFVQAHFSGKIDKRKKGDFSKILETVAQLLETEILTKSNQLESIFKAETWAALQDAISSFDLNKNEEIRKNSLIILQLLSLIIPKRGKRK